MSRADDRQGAQHGGLGVAAGRVSALGMTTFISETEQQVLRCAQDDKLYESEKAAGPSLALAGARAALGMTKSRKRGGQECPPYSGLQSNYMALHLKPALGGLPEAGE